MAALLAPRFAGSAAADSPIVAAASASAYLAGDPEVETYVQKWALSCEFAAAHTALRLLGFDVSEDVMRVLLGSGEDPDVTFRGEIQANQDLDDYGVHARGIQRVVEILKSTSRLPRTVQSRLLYDVDSIRGAVALGQPVVAWVPLDLRPSSRVPVQLSTGKIVNLVYAEHAVTVRGYDGNRLFVLDPHAGAAISYDAGRFAQSMSLFDDPAVAFRLPPPEPTSESFVETGVTLDGGFYRFYRASGGRPVLGLPLTDEMYEPDALTGADKMVIYTETARMEWNPKTGAFGLGMIGEEFLDGGSAPNPNRRVGGAIGQYVNANGGTKRFGYSVSEEVVFDAADPLLPRPSKNAVGQWFQSALVVYLPDRQETVLGRAGGALARKRGLI